MKRDMDVVKAVLEAVEAADKGGTDLLTIEVPDVEPASLGYHLVLLAEGGFLIGEPMTAFGAKHHAYSPMRLTWQGHEFLDTIRSKTAWASVKAFAARQGGSISVEVAKMVALDSIKSHFGIRS